MWTRHKSEATRSHNIISDRRTLRFESSSLYQSNTNETLVIGRSERFIYIYVMKKEVKQLLL